MHFSDLFIATGIDLMSALSDVSADQGDGVARLGARSSKQILALALRSIDNDQADAIVARYYQESGLAKRDLGDELVPNLFIRPKCSYCGEWFDDVNGSMADHINDGHKQSYGRKPAPKSGGGKPVKKGRK